MVTCDRGLPSLPDDITYEVFSRPDIEALKSCSLIDKTLSWSAKPFIRRVLDLTTRSGAPSTERKFFGPWDKFKGLTVLSERGLPQHTHHISISIPESHEIFPDDLEPHVQYLHTLTNPRSQLLNLGWGTASNSEGEKGEGGAHAGGQPSLTPPPPPGAD